MLLVGQAVAEVVDVFPSPVVLVPSSVEVSSSEELDVVELSPDDDEPPPPGEQEIKRRLNNDKKRKKRNFFIFFP